MIYLVVSVFGAFCFLCGFGFASSRRSQSISISEAWQRAQYEGMREEARRRNPNLRIVR